MTTRPASLYGVMFTSVSVGSVAEISAPSATKPATGSAVTMGILSVAVDRHDGAGPQRNGFLRERADDELVDLVGRQDRRAAGSG